MEEPNIARTQDKQKPTLWKWYFGWHPRIFLTAPIFLLFVYQGIWFILKELGDIILYFQTKPVTWGAVFFIFILGSFLFFLLMLPIYICFLSVTWLYEVNIGDYTAWKKFLLSIGTILLVFFGTSIIYLITTWILGI